MIKRRIVVIAAVLVVGVGAFFFGRITTSTNRSPAPLSRKLVSSSASTGATTPTTSPTTKPTTTQVASASKVQLQGCPTTNYGGESMSVMTPTSAEISTSALGSESLLPLPASFNLQLTLYVAANATGGGASNLAVSAPSGWKCVAGYGADGAASITVTGPGSQSVYLSIPNGQGPSTALGCLFFPEAQATNYCEQIGQSSPPSIIGETVQQLSSSEVLYKDPAGVKGNGALSGGNYLDEGVVIWIPSSKLGAFGSGDPGGYAVQADCALSSSESGLCEMILNYTNQTYDDPFRIWFQ